MESQGSVNSKGRVGFGAFAAFLTAIMWFLMVWDRVSFAWAIPALVAGLVLGALINGLINPLILEAAQRPRRSGSRWSGFLFGFAEILTIVFQVAGWALPFLLFRGR